MNGESFAQRWSIGTIAGHFLCMIFSNLLYCCASPKGTFVKPDHIYKIFRPAEWTHLKMSGEFSGSPDDHRDGFIHLSTAEQLKGTLDKHYRQSGELILAEVKAKDLGDTLKYEISRGGTAFPHLYGRLMLDKVSRHWALSPGPQGRYAVDQYLDG